MSQESKEHQKNEQQDPKADILSKIQSWKEAFRERESFADTRVENLTRLFNQVRTIENNPEANNLTIIFRYLVLASNDVSLLLTATRQLLELSERTIRENRDLKEKMPEEIGESFARTLAKIDAMRKASQDGNGDTESLSPAERLFPKKESDEHVQLS